MFELYATHTNEKKKHEQKTCFLQIRKTGRKTEGKSTNFGNLDGNYIRKEAIHINFCFVHRQRNLFSFICLQIKALEHKSIPLAFFLASCEKREFCFVLYFVCFVFFLLSHIRCACEWVKWINGPEWLMVMYNCNICSARVLLGNILN